MPTTSDPAAVRRLFADLLGRAVTVTPTGPDRSVPAAVATYRDDDGSVAAAVGCDLALACGAAGALSMIPAPVVAEAVAGGSVTDHLAANLREVLNICAVLFNAGSERHVRFDDLTVGDPHGEGVALLTGADHTNLTVAIDGYGSGALRLMSLGRG